ncbi:MAG: hypothetical protein ACJ74Q_15120 [Pyrinomonadaceae bacterium]
MGRASAGGAGVAEGSNRQNITARIAAGHGTWETVTYACTLGEAGAVVEALDLDGPEANSYVALAEAKTYAVRRNEGAVEHLTIVRHVTASGQEFCVRVADELGNTIHVCDLEDYVVAEPGETLECVNVPRAVLDSFLSGIAAGAAPLGS